MLVPKLLESVATLDDETDAVVVLLEKSAAPRAVELAWLVVNATALRVLLKRVARRRALSIEVRCGSMRV